MRGKKKKVKKQNVEDPKENYSSDGLYGDDELIELN